MKRKTWSVLTAVLAVSMSGCSALKTWPYFKGDKSKQGATALVESEAFEKVDLALLLRPRGPRCERRSDECESQRLERAFEAFYEENEDEEDKDEKRKLRRNRVQDRLIAASDQSCAEYKRHVGRWDSTNNALLGAVTTSSAGLGAVFTPENTVRALAGTAAIASGIRAELNESYFQQKTIQVIADGFERRRVELRAKMAGENRKSIEEYTVERAIADALRYHDACSLVAGLKEVELSQKRASDPGLEQIKLALKQWEEILNKVRELQKKPDPPLQPPDKNGTDQHGKGDTPTAPRGTTTGGEPERTEAVGSGKPAAGV